MNQINWGIIGCGNVTEVKSGPAFKLVDNSSLKAVMRRNGEKAEDYAKRHQIQKWYDDASQLINDPDINAIYIATPPLQHKDYAIKALMAGKPVYIEKPVTINTSDCLAIIEAQKSYPQKVTVAHYRRELPLFKAIKKIINDDAIGDIRFANLQLFQIQGSAMIANSEENWRVNPAISGGGLFHDLAPHQIDLMLYFFGEPESYGGISSNQAHYSKADDMVCGFIKFKNNIFFNGIWCFNVDKSEEREICEIIGSKGKIAFNIFGNSLKLTRNGKTEQLEFETPMHVQKDMIAKTTAYFRGENENPCSLEEALVSLQIMESFTQSYH